jgi:hypothetical protein
MDRPHHDSCQRNGITVRGRSQRTFTTKSASRRHFGPRIFAGGFFLPGKFFASDLATVHSSRAARSRPWPSITGPSPAWAVNRRRRPVPVSPQGDALSAPSRLRLHLSFVCAIEKRPPNRRAASASLHLDRRLKDSSPRIRRASAPLLPPQ